MAFAALLFYSIEREPRCRLLALFFAAALGHAEIAPGDSDARRKSLGMIRSVGRDQFVNRLRAKIAVRDFLQFSFVVAFRGRSTDVVGEQPLDYLLRGHQSAVAVDRADHRLEHGSKNRGLL